MRLEIARIVLIGFVGFLAAVAAGKPVGKRESPKLGQNIEGFCRWGLVSQLAGGKIRVIGWDLQDPIWDAGGEIDLDGVVAVNWESSEGYEAVGRYRYLPDPPRLHGVWAVVGEDRIGEWNPETLLLTPER